MTFIPRTHENGGVCCSSPLALCDKCKALRLGENNGSYPSPDIYGSGLAKLRAAAATPVSTFEDQYRASRLRDLEATRATLDAELPR
jgi:hypothetical protein